MCFRLFTLSCAAANFFVEYCCCCYFYYGGMIHATIHIKSTLFIYENTRISADTSSTTTTVVDDTATTTPTFFVDIIIILSLQHTHRECLSSKVLRFVLGCDSVVDDCKVSGRNTLSQNVQLLQITSLPVIIAFVFVHRSSSPFSDGCNNHRPSFGRSHCRHEVSGHITGIRPRSAQR